MNLQRNRVRMPGLALVALLGGAMPSLADVYVTVDPGQAWLGYMNVYDLPDNGGAYLWGSAWGTADLTAVFTGPVLALAPNTIGDPDPYWYTPSGGPGATGNKIMEANMYVEPAGSLPGQNVLFSGIVLSSTLLPSHTCVAFIKDFAPDYSSFIMVTVPLTSAGTFSVSLATVDDPTRHVQYGFFTIGPNVWITDVDPYGNVQITARCHPDYNGDGFMDGIDYDLFNADFENLDPAQQMHADYNGDGFVDGIDYDLFNSDFETGC